MTCACAIKLTVCIVTHFLPYIFQPINIKMKPNPLLSHPLKSFTAICLLGAGSLHAATVWNAGINSTWDTTTANWTGSAYTNGDDAEFLGAGAGTVTLTGVIDPSSVLVSSANDYTFSGAAITGTGALTKTGSGTLTLTAQNSYTGGTIVNGGTLDLVGQEIIDGALTVDGSSSVVKISGTGHNATTGISSLTVQNGGTLTDNTTGGRVQSMNLPVTFINGGTLTSEAGADGHSLFGNFLFGGDIAVTGAGLATISANRVGFNYARTITVADAVAGAGTDLLISSEITTDDRQGIITKDGAGTLTLTGVNQNGSNTDHHDDWTINNGTLEIRNGSAIEDTSVVTVNASGTFEVDDNETIGRIGGAGNVTLNANLTTGDTTSTEISGNISGSGALIKQGASTLTLSGDNSAFSGGITLLAANQTLVLNSANAAGTGALAFNHGTKLYNGASGPSTISNDISTTGWFFWEAGSKALEIAGNWTNESQVIWTNSANTLTMSGIVSGTASTSFYGNGTIALTNDNNSFTGNYTATLDSTIQFTSVADSGVNSALGAGTTIGFDSANQSFNGYIENIGAGGSTNRAITFGATNSDKTAGIANNGTGALDFTGTFTNNSNTGATRTLLLGGDYDGQNSISSALSDGGNGGQLALTKEGTTTWALSGINSYTGNTSINGGTLLINGDQSAATGTVTVNSGATLGAAGTAGKIGGDTTIAAGGAFTLVDGQVDSLLTLSGSLDITAIDPGSLKFELGAGEASDTVALNNLFMSSLELGDFEFTEFSGVEAGTYTLFQVTQDYTADFGAGATGTLFGFNAELAKDNNNLVLNLTAVPEPSSTALLGLGGLALILRRRRDK